MLHSHALALLPHDSLYGPVTGLHTPMQSIDASYIKDLHASPVPRTEDAMCATLLSRTLGAKVTVTSLSLGGLCRH